MNMNEETKHLICLSEDLLSQIKKVIDKDSEIIEDYDYINSEITNVLQSLFNIFGKVKEYKIIESGGEEEYHKEIERMINQ